MVAITFVKQVTTVGAMEAMLFIVLADWKVIQVTIAVRVLAIDGFACFAIVHGRIKGDLAIDQLQVSAAGACCLIEREEQARDGEPLENGSSCLRNSAQRSDTQDPPCWYTNIRSNVPPP